MKKVVLLLTAAFLLAGCAYQAELEMVGSMLPSLLDKEKRETFRQFNATFKSAMAHEKKGRYDKSLNDLKQAFILSKKIGNKRFEIMTISLFSMIYAYMGEYEKALQYMQKVQEQLSQFENRLILDEIFMASAVMQVGNIHGMLGNFDKGEMYLTEALYRYEGIQQKHGRFFNDHATVLTSLGLLYMETGDYQKAVNFISEAASKSRKHELEYDEAVALSGLSGAYLYLREYDKATEYCKDAIKSFQKTGYTSRAMEASVNLSEIYLENQQPDHAYEYLQKSLILVPEGGMRDLQWKLHRNYGHYHQQKGQYKKALSQYDESIQAIESARSALSNSQFRTGYMRDKLKAYDEYIQLLNTLHRQHPEKGYDRKSFEIFERRQGRAFLEEMGKTGARQYSGLPEDVRNKEMRLEKQIGLLSNQLSIQRSKDPKDRDLNAIRRIEQELENAKSLLQQLEQEIEAKYPDYYALKYPKPIQIEDLQQDFLRPGEAMLVYHVMEDQTCLWTISKTHFSGAAIDVGRDELNQKIGSFRKHALRLAQQDQRGSVIRLKQKEDADIQEIPDLHDLLFPANLQHRISRAQNLYIVPTGPLYLLPFEALKTKNDHYLIEKQGVSYLSSASLLGILRQSQARRDKKAPYPLLAFANPVYKDAPSVPQTSHANPAGSRDARSGKLPELRNEILRSAMQGNFIELPETEDEAKEIRDILNAPSASDPLQLRQKASRNNVLDFNAAGRLDDYRYLVFACHGVIPDSTSIVKQPALVLSHPDPATNGDGFLTMSDVFALKMNADLATLSACNTGRGESVPSEGVMGLTRAFMYAGAPAVTVTLWSINSLAAKELNVGLFKHLKTGKGRMRALRQIKLAMIDGEHGQKWRHPYYWAPLVMFGDGN